MGYESLDGKRKLFVDHYLGRANCNKTEAARLAGYASPGQEGHRLYKEPEIREAIEERLREVAIGADEILARLSEQARADMADFVSVDEGGGFRINLEAAERAGKLRLVKKIGFDQKGRPLLELHDSQSALLAMAKRYRLFPDRQELTGADGRPVQVGLTHAELLDAAREPLEPEVVAHPAGSCRALGAERRYPSQHHFPSGTAASQSFADMLLVAGPGSALARSDCVGDRNRSGRDEARQGAEPRTSQSHKRGGRAGLPRWQVVARKAEAGEEVIEVQRGRYSSGHSPKQKHKNQRPEPRRSATPVTRRLLTLVQVEHPCL